MASRNFKVRLMQPEDFQVVVGIDERVLGYSRLGYYEMKFDKLILSPDCLPTSLVATDSEGKVIGFVMGELYAGEYGIQQTATLDTIGVDPDYRERGIGRLLIEEYVKHLRDLDVGKISTLVSTNERELVSFFTTNRFTPSKTINLELDIGK